MSRLASAKAVTTSGVQMELVALDSQHVVGPRNPQSLHDGHLAGSSIDHDDSICPVPDIPADRGSCVFGGAWISHQFIDGYCGIIYIIDKIYYIYQFGTQVDRSGQFPARRTVMGPRDNPETNVLRFPLREARTPERKTVVSGRMSSRGRKDGQPSQMQAMKAYGRGARLAVDARRPAIGGGLHCTLRIFLFLTDRIEKRAIHHLSVVRLAPLPQAER